MDHRLLWIIGSGLLMALIALSGSVFLLLPQRALTRLLPALVAFAAGSLLGGGLFHMLPAALRRASAAPEGPLALVAVGFAAFFALDQLMEWRHARAATPSAVRPLGPLLLFADGAHNLIGGLAIGALFVADVRAGAAAWLGAALHELPQEVGDFAAIVHAGYSRRRALAYNFLSALTFPLGGVVARGLQRSVDVAALIALGCGNFIYIAAATLLPEVKRAQSFSQVAARFAAFASGLGLLYAAGALKALL